MDYTGRYGLLELLRLAYVENPGGDLTEKQLRPYLNPCTSLRTIAKGGHIVRSNQGLTSVSLVVSGEFYLTRSTSAGQVNMVSRTAAPEFVGTPQLLLEDRTFYSNIIAGRKCLLVDFDPDYFHKGMLASGEIATIVATSLSAISMRHIDRANRLAFHDATENLVAYICRKWAAEGAPGETLLISEKHTLIATDLGTTVRTVCRSISKLRERDLLSTTKNGTLVITPRQMEELRRWQESMQ